MLVTDSQIHLWELSRPDRPWPQPVLVEPQLPDGFVASQAIAAMDAAGVDRAVIVPPTWVGENNATALEAAADYPGRFAVMGRFNPLALDAKEQLAHWRDTPNLLGVRMTFRVKPFSDWLEDGTLDWFFETSQERGIPFMALVSGNTAKIRPVAERYPGLKLIIDHMGIDLAAKGKAAYEGLDDLLALAAFPNVTVKTSSAPCFSAEPYPFRDLYDLLRSIYDSFGPQRMLWGADYTRLTSTYEECLRHFQRGLDFLSEDDREWVLGKTAATVLGWPET